MLPPLGLTMKEWSSPTCCFWCPPHYVENKIFLEDKKNWCLTCEKLMARQSKVFPYVESFFCVCETKQVSLEEWS